VPIGTVADLQQAQSEIAGLNKKIIDPVPEKILKSGSPIYIYNVGPWRWIRSMASLGTYTIMECPPGQRHSPPLVIPHLIRETIPHEASNWRMGNRFEDGEDVALAILGEGPFQSKEQGYSRVGVFIAKGEEPTEQELVKAENLLRQYRETQVAEADAYWNAGPQQYQMIVAEHREAAAALGVEREWVKPIRETIECPGCGARVNPRIALHAVQQGGCGAIINRERYEKMEWAS